MAGEKTEVLLLGPAKPRIADGLRAAFDVHHVAHPKELDASRLAQLAPVVTGMAVSGPPGRVDAALIAALPRLACISSFGVGYDHVDAKAAAARGVTVCNTPDVLNEEVADTAIGLLLSTVRQLPQADRYVRAGKWLEAEYPLSASLRDRTVGLVGLGRIGKAIARRLEAMQVPVAYHARRMQADVGYTYYPNLVDMARAVDVLLLITPGGAETRHLVNAEVLAALGANGILINMSRGTVVDEAALIAALQQRTILTAGLDVYAHEPRVPAELLAMDHVVLFPHVGSASVATRAAMEQLVVDNLVAFCGGKPPLTPVAETPWPPQRA